MDVLQTHLTHFEGVFHLNSNCLGKIYLLGQEPTTLRLWEAYTTSRQERHIQVESTKGKVLVLGVAHVQVWEAIFRLAQNKDTSISKASS